MLPLVRDEIRALVEDFAASRVFAAKERSILPGEGAVGFDALALVVVESLRESLRYLVAKGQRDHPKIFRATRRRILGIEGIVKVLRILYENAQVEGIEASEDILGPMLLVLGTFPICEGAPPKAEGRLLWRHGIRLNDVFECFHLARLLGCRRRNFRRSGNWQILAQQTVCLG